MRYTRKAGMYPSKLSKKAAVFTPKLSKNTSKLSKNAAEFTPIQFKPPETIKRIDTISKHLREILTPDDWIEINDLISFDTTLEFTDKNDIVILFNAYQRPGDPMSLEGHISNMHITQHPDGSINRKGAFHFKLAYNHNGTYHNIHYRIYLFGSEEEKFIISISRNLLQLGELYIDMETDYELRKLPPQVIQELSIFIYPFVSSFGEAFSLICNSKI